MLPTACGGASTGLAGRSPSRERVCSKQHCDLYQELDHNEDIHEYEQTSLSGQSDHSQNTIASNRVDQLVETALDTLGRVE